MPDDPLSQSQIVKRKRLWEAWTWLRQNLLPVGIIAVSSAMLGHFEAYIGYGYRISSIETASQETKNTVNGLKDKIDGMKYDGDIRELRVKLEAAQKQIDGHEERLNLAQGIAHKPVTEFKKRR